MALAVAGLVALMASPAGATTVNDEATFRAAWTNAAETQIDLAADVTLTCAGGGVAIRNSATAVTLDGQGHTITQSCANNGVLQQDGAGALAFQNVTITGGNTAGSGAGVLSSSANVSFVNSTVTGNTAGQVGGGIRATASGSLITLTNSTVSQNRADAFGGGISSNGAVTLIGSTMTGNSTGNEGGAISADEIVSLTNSTITGNTAEGDGGGGIAHGPVSLVYSTVVSNTGPAGSNIFHTSQFPQQVTSFASVVALPGGGGTNCVNLAGTTSNGFNFSDDASCGFSQSTDRQNAGYPGLAALANNGGPTQTRLPLAGSPLIDAVPAGSCQADGASGVGTDQRGVTRPQGPGCDVGAVEVEVAGGPPPTGGPPAPAGPAQPVTGAPRFTG